MMDQGEKYILYLFIESVTNGWLISSYFSYLLYTNYCNILCHNFLYIIFVYDSYLLCPRGTDFYENKKIYFSYDN